MTLEMQDKALALVAQYVQEKNPETVIGLYDFRVKSFSKTLLNWEAIVEKKTDDGMHYHVIYDGYSAELHLYVYARVAVVKAPEKRN